MNMLEKLRAMRAAGEISTSSNGPKLTGEGKFSVKVVEAKWEKNRAGDSDQGRLKFEVVDVIEGAASENGSTFSEYVSLKNEEMAMKKFLQISDWMKAAGVPEEKLVDDDDEGDDLSSSMMFLIQCLARQIKKRDITATVFRKTSDKVDSKGRAYFNNYFDDPFQEEEESDNASVQPPKAKGNPSKKDDDDEVKSSPYKKKHTVEDED